MCQCFSVRTAQRSPSSPNRCRFSPPSTLASSSPSSLFLVRRWVSISASACRTTPGSCSQGCRRIASAESLSSGLAFSRNPIKSFASADSGEHLRVEVGRESLVDLELEVGLAPVQPEVWQGPEADGPEQQPDGAVGQLPLQLYSGLQANAEAVLKFEANF